MERVTKKQKQCEMVKDVKKGGFNGFLREMSKP
jgi:hypothetical protein